MMEIRFEILFEEKWFEPWLFFWISQLILEERMWLILQRAPKVVLRSYVFDLEFIIYQLVCFLIFAIWLPSTFPRLRYACAIDRRCAGRLRYTEEGWQDLSDDQWRDFSAAAPLLAGGCVAGTILGMITGRYKEARGLTALAVLWVSHGQESVFLVALFALFAIGHSSFSPIMIWILITTALFLKESSQARRITTNFGFSTGLRRWWQALPLFILRTTSFCFDSKNCTTIKDWLLNGFTYVFYAPLQATGPIMRYSKFESTSIQNSLSLRSYIIRTVLAWYMLHKATSRVPTFALTSTPGLFIRLTKTDTSAALALVFVALNIIWLKFTVIWRFAKCLALLDGVDPPENMRRFVCNNFTIAGFWRNWHTSFYEWLQYYLYRPLLRRTKSKTIATVSVFAFVVLWHDLEPKLYVWGTLNSLCIALERFSGLDRAARECIHLQLTSTSKNLFWRRARLSALGSLYITILVVANAVGFASHSFDDLFFALQSIFISAESESLLRGLTGLCFIFLVFFVGTQNALLVRLLEARYISSPPD
uniref:Uncharacterized protein n=1 Tax=Aureoumbra lagunensis TaxID=44058 RepID=A0A7S3NKC0_9STRA|mmetsp:Transcript_23463/g.30478  ORF Transcript_23463/g.30478 Transcript_23463/m.30478 type:complete len:536 (+) Transcript_23463:68-1675(+)